MAQQKCELKMRKFEEELEELTRQHCETQNKKMEFANNEEENIQYINKVCELKRNIARFSKVAFISQSDDAKIRELEKSILELREEQEELHTKLREELQRKEQLEQQILREDRCARNPLFSSSRIMDEDDSDKEMEMEAPVADQIWSPNVVFPFGRKGDSEAKSKQKLMPKQKKRKLASSAGDSQSENSIRGDSRLGFREKGKNGPLEKSYSESSVKETENQNPDFIRKEIGMLRIARDNLILKRQKIDKRLRKGRTKGNGCEEERKLLEYDEAVEGLDSVIERKNEVLTGKATQIQPFAPLLTKSDLEERLKCLSLAELHFLLVKFFSRTIDLRIEFRKHELDFAELENQFDEQNRYICNLKAAYQQASLEMERRLTSLQREYQYKISYLLKQFNEDTTGHGVHEMKLLEMEQQLYYYKKLSRELKEKLREYLNQGSSRPAKEIESIPGPSGIKNHNHSRNYDHMSTFYHRVIDSSPSVANQAWPRRGRRFALHANGMNSNTTKVTRQKNKLIIQHKGENLTS
ncbi:Kinesin-like protein KIF7 [Armadillidium nasatum]|uniref:Kinesin-like protein KIF7 n=1 Tax=Armadillidium nasatum TaxID=96803 RepID=A0A5N5T0V5_9CRUS|nr:Kinesin-like protein KIF7 [Armadillidium nasatum]